MNQPPRHCEERSDEAIQSFRESAQGWIASPSVRNDGFKYGLVVLFLLIFCFATHTAAAQTKVDSSEPIQISADSLEVLQAEKKAIFTGNVIAVQGQVTLKSARMTVYYRNGGQEGDNALGGANGVSKIEVEGSVLLATPEETAEGEKGVYLVDERMIHLTGNVVLTREKNILKGAKLDYNLATGRSLLSGGTAVTTGGGESGGRVRGLFVPKKQ